MRTRQCCLIFIILVGMLIISVPVTASEGARILKISGGVKVNGAPAQAEQILNTGDRLTTDASGMCIVMIESDAVSTEMYQERLDEILSLGAEADEGKTGLSESGQTVMDIWDKMDTGLIADKNEAFDEADRRVREQQSAPAEE